MYQIRPSRLEDARAVAEMHVRSWRDAYAGLLPQAMLDGLSVDRREEGWIKAFNETPARRRTWLAVEEPRVLGFVTAGPSRDEEADKTHVGEILGIYVDKRHWGAGLGRELMRIGLEHLRSIGMREATLWVLHNNTRAHRFYEAAGFRPDGATKDEKRGEYVLHELRYRAKLESAAPGVEESL